MDRLESAAHHPRVSAVVIAYNDEMNMRACLESVTWADEIIVVDSFSTDRTAAISREFTDQVYQHAFEGFGRLRNEAIAHASCDWVFSLDTDERATLEVRDEVRRRLAEGPDAQAYFVPRSNNFLGRWIKHCGWYPDYRQPQFFHKAHFEYKEDLVHESFTVDGRVGYFSSPVKQYPFRSIDHYFSKMDRYSSLMAQEMKKRRRRFYRHQLFTHPLFTFLKMYILRLGILDGRPGLILSGLYAYYTFVKYAKFWELDLHESAKPHHPS
ncbi:MAG: glycosyltransferase family 2 protein [Nitrospirales bacterium]|nr:glycosyltransferase family 2 protein [Nitrospira sp.]MDR4502400.1 glycosyltransferase family 2 protein [Nitrospirales bacterium]